MTITNIPRRPFGPTAAALIDIAVEIDHMEEDLTTGVKYQRLEAIPYDDIAAISTAIGHMRETLGSIERQITEHLKKRRMRLRPGAS